MECDEAWLAALGDVAREQARNDGAEGVGDKQGTGSGVLPSEARRAFSHAVHQPLSAESKARIAQSLQRPQPERTGRVVRPRRWLLPAGAMAAAAAALLVLLPGRGASPVQELPQYTLAVHGGRQDTRGEAAQLPLRLRSGRPLELLLRPGTRHAGQVELRAVLHSGDAQRELTLPFERSESGALRVHGNAGTLLSGANAARGTLALAVCEGEGCVLAQNALAKAAESRGSGWQVWVLPFVWEGSSSP